jgi:hypothetical protein
MDNYSNGMVAPEAMEASEKIAPMREQMYVVTKLEDALSQPLVPESELIRRIQRMRDLSDRTYATSINLLLYG